jgi:hypothetical protein
MGTLKVYWFTAFACEKINVDVDSKDDDSSDEAEEAKGQKWVGLRYGE